jgi:hypothetical protein
MSNLFLDKQNRFVINEYSSAPPFSSFLPGIAGPLGIPMWVFYTNRGQAITSFGIESKDHPILEFQSANKAYQSTPYTGFRTFIKLNGDHQSPQTYEPFSALPAEGISRQMLIGMNELELVEDHASLGLCTSVVYFTVTGENFAGLIRCLTIKNENDRPLEIELLDGLPNIIPYGINNFQLKEFSRTVEAWMDVFNLENNIPFYRVRASIEDKPEVETFEAGHFALAFTTSPHPSRLLHPLIDANIVFGQNTSLSAPDEFYKYSLCELNQREQITCGKTPCGFFGHQTRIAPSESITIYSIYGHLSSVEALNQEVHHWLSEDFILSKRAEARLLTNEITDAIDTHTSIPLFDSYCRQTYLDNVIRGGLPVIMGEGENKAVYHIYSRKHGDPERDYNAFLLAPEFYSQGNGNYRDVNQNRRSDVLFNPQVTDTNLRTFIGLIQADGYNPLVVQGCRFTLKDEQLAEILKLTEQPHILEPLLKGHFTPGRLLKQITDHKVKLGVPLDEFLSRVIQRADQHFEADFHEGYWTDHWTYNLDQIESYLAVYPERKATLLVGQPDLPFYDSAAMVNPRHKKYILTDSGPRQLNAVVLDHEKEALIASRKDTPHLLRTDHGKGEIYYATLFTKLLMLALIKFASMDPWGMGIEMEAGRPGWYDAMNGLPALFGSAMPETYELKRLLQFLQQAIDELGDFTAELPIEVFELLQRIVAELRTYNGSQSPERDLQYWDRISSAREQYRSSIRLGLDGQTSSVKVNELASHISLLLAKVEAGIERAAQLNNGLPPTYFTYQVVEYEPLADDKGQTKHDETGRLYFRAKRFEPKALPLFLEGFVRALKVASSEEAASLYQQVKASDLFDRKLKMYKVNTSLNDQSHDIGRARAFTPGWLENESIWLHMEYKYLLEVLKAGLYDEFFEDFKNTLVPFFDPKVYQRSPLENSSFLVSSAHPDKSLHGAGFVARLSGSTAEFLSVWNIMMAGKAPFFVENGVLCLKFAPILPDWLFTADGEISYKFLGCCAVTYHNPQKLDTFKTGVSPVRMKIHYNDGMILEIDGNTLSAPHAESVRSGHVTRIDIYYPQE